MPLSSDSGGVILKTARAAVLALKNSGFDCCLVGSAACAIYGMENRKPNDIDIVVLSTRDPEVIKDKIKSCDDNFFLVRSTNRRNTYRVLWYRIPGDWHTCKVDILVPGILSIPPMRYVRYRASFPDIPVAQLLVVLLLKLRAWTDHRSPFTPPYMRQKVPADKKDIDELLELAVKKHKVHLQTEKELPEWFVREGRERVKEYIKEWPASIDNWKSIGLTASVY